jgi:hypothetical protein
MVDDDTREGEVSAPFRGPLAVLLRELDPQLSQRVFGVEVDTLAGPERLLESDEAANEKGPDRPHPFFDGRRDSFLVVKKLLPAQVGVEDRVLVAETHTVGHFFGPHSAESL